jgi:hydrogenase maturation protease
MTSPQAIERSRPTDVNASPDAHHPAVEILVCGSPDRGDDAAPSAAVQLIAGHLPESVHVRTVRQLDIDDLLAVPTDAGVVVVDAAIGLVPGTVVELPLTGLAGRGRRVRPRSSHALAFPEVLGIARVLRGRPLRGRIVAIGGKDFGLGAPLSPPVASAVGALGDGVVAAVAAIAAEPASDEVD